VSACMACGHQLGVGRFCTNCGASVDSSTPDGTPVSTPVTSGDWRTDTAERRLGPVVAPSDPRTPPAAVAPPPPPRYPLFADELDSWAGSAPEPASEEPGPAAATEDVGVALLDWDQQHDDGAVATPFYAEYDEEPDERRTALPWILTAVVVLALVAAGWWFLVRDNGSEAARDGSGGPAGSAGSSQTPAAAGVEVAGRAAARAPQTAPPNQDVDGDQVSYDASNMLDGVPETTWRAPGDVHGMVLSFKLREPTELHQVGLINGYAKTSTDDKGRTFDWYLGNRRVETVLWVFDDGTKVRQQLEQGRELQTVDLDTPVTTTKVRLKLVTVSAPGDGTAARDFTAVSEVSMVGVPQE